MDNINEIEMFSPEEMQSPFEAIKETDGEGREWWNSRKLATSVEGNVLIYRSSTGKVNVNVLFSQDTFWLSQKRMSELFNVTIQDISYHLLQINDTGELQLSTAIKKILNSSDNCDEQSDLLYTQSPHQVLKCGDWVFIAGGYLKQLPVSLAFCLFSIW
ncbi:MAG: hypothetical protein UHP25_01040 [Prevotella sp.]|nr:hypothetical protein [Prevotella sp.]